jgi:hypothetical protein
MSDAGGLLPKEPQHWDQPEHRLGVKVHEFARAFVAVPHSFLAFDRAKKQTERQHIHEASRGVRRGTLDTLLMVIDMVDFWCELKVPPNKVREGDSQWEMMMDLRRVHRHAAVATSVTEYWREAVKVGIPFTPGAEVAAMRYDALLESARAKAKAGKPLRPHKPTKPRRPRVQASRKGLKVAAWAQRPPSER